MVKMQEKKCKKNSRKALLLYERQEEGPEEKFLEKDSQVTSPGQKSDYRDHCTLLYSYKREKDTREWNTRRKGFWKQGKNHHKTRKHHQAIHLPT